MKWIFIIGFVSALLFIGCKKDTESGSGEADILNFTVAATDDFVPRGVHLEQDGKLIYIFSSSYIGVDKFPLSLTAQVEISLGAIVNPTSGSVIEFEGREEFVKYSTISENGSTTNEWLAILRDNQIPNSDFENWYEAIGMNSKPFLDPGKHPESTVWATANKGTSTYNVYGTTPLEESGNTMVSITTGETSLIPVTSGTLFLGRFDLSGAIQNPTKPDKATDYTIPFTFRPTALKLKYKYKAGDKLIQGTLKNPDNLFGGFTIKEFTGKDEFSILGTLEVREKETVKVVAEFKLRGGDTEDILTEKIINYEYYTNDTPTHITLIFASSADGNLWKGAVGSRLILDDLELVYE